MSKTDGKVNQEQNPEAGRPALSGQSDSGQQLPPEIALVGVPDDEPVGKTSGERESAVSAEGPDPFDPSRLRLSQDFGEQLGVQKLRTTVLVRKPAKEWFVRTHPDRNYRVNTSFVELKEERELYLVDRTLWPELATSESTFSPRAIVTTITRQGLVFLWPIRLPGADGKIDDWNRSALEAADVARDKWTRVTANMHLGAYDVSVAVADLPEPTWPAVPFRDLLEIAFRDRFIDSLDHVVLRKLRGEL